MASLRVTVMDQTGSRRNTADLPDDVPMSRLVPAIVSRMDLGGGSPVCWVCKQQGWLLRCKRMGCSLGEKETLVGAGVQPEDELRLIQQMSSGPCRLVALPEYFRWQPQRGWTRVETNKLALWTIAHHACNGPDHTVAGLLVGTFSHRDGWVISIESAVPASYARSTETLSSESGDLWAQMLADFEQIKEQHSDWRVVGWYHTHPNVGIFLSPSDEQTHQTLCTESWQVALVYDPYSDCARFFVRDEQGVLVTTKSRRDRFCMSQAIMPRAPLPW